MSKLDEDVTETLEVIPRQWKVVQTIREKFSCRDCEKITQPPAPFHVTPRGLFGPGFLAMCWSHPRRYFFELVYLDTQLKKRRKKAPVISPIAVEAVRRIDAILDIERAINGRAARRPAGTQRTLAGLEAWLRDNRSKLSKSRPVAEPIVYILKAWPAFTAFLVDGRICFSNNSAERAPRGIAQGRKSWLFAGSDRGGQRTAFMLSLIATAKLNDIDPQAWLTDVLGRIADIPQRQLAICSLGTGALTKFSAKLPEPRYSPQAYLLPVPIAEVSLANPCLAADFRNRPSVLFLRDNERLLRVREL